MEHKKAMHAWAEVLNKKKEEPFAGSAHPALQEWLDRTYEAVKKESQADASAPKPKRSISLRTLVSICAAAIILIGLFPPWAFHFRYGITRNAGYSFITLPPFNGFMSAHIDFPRLIVAWVICAMVSTLLIYLKVSKRS
jgi:hypothetical protein